MPTLRPERLRELGESIFLAAGASPENAARVTASLVDANLAGHDSHGVQHFPGYVDLDPGGARSSPTRGRRSCARRP